MKKHYLIGGILILSLFAGITDANAQNKLGGKLGNMIKNAKETVNGNTQNTSSSSSVSSQSSNNGSSASSVLKSKGATKANNGPVYYVKPDGSNRADGLSPETAKKDIQKVLNIIRDAKQDGAVVNVAGGDYLGELDAGYIEIYNCISLLGGWNDSFTERDPQKWVTRIQPGTEQLGTNGAKALITISNLDDLYNKKEHPLIIDGFCLDMGFQNDYKPANPDDPECACPVGCETGRMKDEQVTHQAMKSGAINADVTICNCLFLNSPNFGIMMCHRGGNWEIYNNVFVSNRYSSVRIDGWDKNGENSYINFHHNTVAFSWCRTKTMEDMGYGYEFMSRVNADVHHNIFLCNNYAAIARTHADSDKSVEAKRVTSAYNNIFFMNAADLQLPAVGGGKWLNVACKNFEDVDEKILKNVDGNFELKKEDPFLDVIDQAYLNGFVNLKCISSSSYDANSAANLYRQAHGMNTVGTEIVRVSMYGNRYNFDKALKFFGAKEGYGAQSFK
jgi:hypothetical protein